MALNDITGDVIGAAIAVQRELGIGLYEKVYERALAMELRSRGHRVEAQVELAASYRGVQLGLAYILDLLVDDCVVVEVKSVARLTLVHRTQLITQLRIAEKPVGLVLNFGGLVGRSLIRVAGSALDLPTALAELDGRAPLR